MRKAIAALGLALTVFAGGAGSAATLAENNEAMYRLMMEKRGVTAAQISRIRACPKLRSCPPWTVETCIPASRSSVTR